MTTANGKNGKPTKKDETAARIIKALGECDGLLTTTAKRSGIGYRTICRYVAEYPSVKEAAQDAKESLLDFAESKLFEKIKAGDNTCIIFYLKCQGKARGYIERTEIANPQGEAFKVDHSAKDALLGALNRLNARITESEGRQEPK